MAISLLLPSGERIPPLPPLPWRERAGVRGQEVAGPNRLDSMLFSLFANIGEGAAKYVGLTPDVSGGTT